MTRNRIAVAILLFALSVTGWPSHAQQQQAQAKNSNDPIERIKDEGMNRSQVMQTLSYLTDVIGPRLTASPNLKRANEWTRDKMKEWGMEAHLEPWGPFGRGWTLKSFSAEIIAPQAIPLAGLINIERRHGKDEFVIEKALVRMDSPAMQFFAARRDEWAASDLFSSPGPRQFWGPTTHQLPISVALNSGADSLMFRIG